MTKKDPERVWKIGDSGIYIWYNDTGFDEPKYIKGDWLDKEMLWIKPQPFANLVSCDHGHVMTTKDMADIQTNEATAYLVKDGQFNLPPNTKLFYEDVPAWEKTRYVALMEKDNFASRNVWDVKANIRII